MFLLVIHIKKGKVMSSNKKLVRKIDFLKAKQVHLILNELSQDFVEGNIEDEFKEDTTELNSEKLGVLKDLIKILVQNDSDYAEKIENILNEERNQTPKDITFVTEGGVFVITWMDIGLFLSFLLARDLIRAFKPSEEIEETEIDEKDGKTKSKKIIIRKYNADLINLAKAYLESKKGE